jgi:CheY-like chemotaxis protein
MTTPHHSAHGLAPILHAEPNENDAFLLHTAFQAAGIHHPLRLVSNGRQAMDYIAGVAPFSDRHRCPPPHLVLLERKLPSIDGLQVLQWIREHSAFPQLPVIMLSCCPLPEDMHIAYGLGVTSYITKPLTLTDITRLAKAIKDFWLTWHQAPPVQPRVAHHLVADSRAHGRASVRR